MFRHRPETRLSGAAAGPASRQRRNSKGLRQSSHQQVVSEAWLPKSDMISVRSSPQKGHGGGVMGAAASGWSGTALLDEEVTVAVAAGALDRLLAG